VNEPPLRLALQTAFETPVPSLPVPGTLTSGNRPELMVVDKVARGVALLGRFGATPALFGLKVRPNGGPVRVCVRFSIDDASVAWWEARAPEHQKDCEGARGRLFLVRSQGVTRAAVFLVPGPQDADGVTRGEVRFDLSADELDEAGLLVVEVQSIDHVPPWARQQLTPFAAIGVRIDAVDLADVDHEAVPLVHQLSVGGVAPARSPASAGPTASSGPKARAASVASIVVADREAVALRSDLFVASPGGPAPARWTLRARLNRPLGPANVDLDGPDDSVLAEGPATSAPDVAAPDVTLSATASSGGGRLGSIARILRSLRGSSNGAVVAGTSLAAVNEPTSQRANEPAHPSHATTVDSRGFAALSLTDLLENLLGRNRLRVEAVGLAGTWVPEPSLVVRSVELDARAVLPSASVVTEFADIDVDLGDTLCEPVLVGVLVDPGALRAVPGFDHATLTWELLVPRS